MENLKHTYMIASSEIFGAYELDDDFTLLSRPAELDSKTVSLGSVLKWGLGEINNRSRFPDYVIYANPEYIFRPEDLLQKLIDDACCKGLDSAFVGYTEYSTYWSYNSDRDDYIPFGKDLLPRTEKHALYKSLFGLGCITRSRIIREGEIVGRKKIGIISTSDVKHTLRVSDPHMLSLIKNILLSKDAH